MISDTTNLQFNPSPSAIMHLDLNSCFATIEQQANPHLRGKPVAVAAYTTDNACILAPSIEAKRFGVTVGMRIREGKRLCPRLIVLSPDPAKYRFINRKLIKLLGSYTDDITVKSIDEMVLNFTHSPYLKRGMITIAKEIKMRIKKEIGYFLTVSIGIAPNRFLAKTASSLHKPDGLDEINHKNFREVYRNLRVEQLCGIKIGNGVRLNSAGIFTVWDMYNATFPKLKGAFRSILGYHWYLRLHGYEIDNVEFSRKSYGHSYALYKPLTLDTGLNKILCKLVEKMGSRLRQAGFTARGVHISCQYSDRSFWHHGQTMKETLYSSNDLYKAALKVFMSSPYNKPVRTLAVSCFALSKNSLNQLSLINDEEEKRAFTQALDKVNRRFGQWTVFPANMMGTSDKVLDRIAFGV